jgi:hypothetical protein
MGKTVRFDLGGLPARSRVDRPRERLCNKDLAECAPTPFGELVNYTEGDLAEDLELCERFLRQERNNHDEDHYRFYLACSTQRALEAQKRTRTYHEILWPVTPHSFTYLRPPVIGKITAIPNDPD